MLQRTRIWRRSFLASLLYFAGGNLIGYAVAQGALEAESAVALLFFPYTMLWTLASLVGWDPLAVLMQAVLLAVGTAVCLPVLWWWANRKA